jgi:glycosyltransferase involved in cell wall biosynthesis
MARVPTASSDRVSWVSRPSIVVDVRMIASSGIGTYLQNTLSRMVAARPDWRFTLLGERAQLESAGLDSPANVQVRETRAPIYSLREQLAFAAPGLRRADLFWSPHYNVPLLSTRRLLVTVHDVMHLALPEYQRRWPHRQYATTMYSAVRRRAAAVICNSEYTRRELDRLAGPARSTHVIHLGVDPSWFAAARPLDGRAARPYIVFVGLAKPHKNLVGLLRAFAMIRDRIPHDLTIIGGNPHMLRTADNRIAAEAAGLGDRLHVFDRLQLGVLQQCVAGADLLVQPSLCEGFGLPPLEAMAAGTPCLVSRIEPLIEVCGEAAAYCDPHDPPDIAEQLLGLLQSPATRHDLRRRGRHRARTFTWDRTADATLSIFEQVLAS